MDRLDPVRAAWVLTADLKLIRVCFLTELLPDLQSQEVVVVVCEEEGQQLTGRTHLEPLYTLNQLQNLTHHTCNCCVQGWMNLRHIVCH